MAHLDAELIAETAKALYIRALRILPPDVKSALARAHARETHPRDLMPECLWRFRVRELGPLTVGMDAHGGDLYADVLAEAKSRLGGIYAKLGL